MASGTLPMAHAMPMGGYHMDMKKFFGILYDMQRVEDNNMKEDTWLHHKNMILGNFLFLDEMEEVFSGDGRRIIKKASANIWLCSIPEFLFEAANVAMLKNHGFRFHKIFIMDIRSKKYFYISITNNNMEIINYQLYFFNEKEQGNPNDKRNVERLCRSGDDYEQYIRRDFKKNRQEMTVWAINRIASRIHDKCIFIPKKIIDSYLSSKIIHGGE